MADLKNAQSNGRKLVKLWRELNDAKEDHRLDRTDFIDAVADIMHFADVKGYDAHQILSMATIHFNEETWPAVRSGEAVNG